MSKLSKIIVILGPTASGKTDLAIKLAQKFDGEVISADSRQVYKEMDIGTAKPAGNWRGSAYIVDGAPHHLVDIVNPDEEFSLADFKNQAESKIEEIIKQGKLPIVVGGTGLYISALIDNLDIAEATPNNALRKKLEVKPLAELVRELKAKDENAEKIVDLKNKRRVVRALEVIMGGGAASSLRRQCTPLYDVLQIGLNWPQPELYQNIDKRTDAMIETGLLKEVEKILKKYFGALPSMSGIGYKEITQYLAGEMTLPEAIRRIKLNTQHYARRQKQWFKRDKRINWIDKDNGDEAKKLVEMFLK